MAYELIDSTPTSDQPLSCKELKVAVPRRLEGEMNLICGNDLLFQRVEGEVLLRKWGKGLTQTLKRSKGSPGPKSKGNRSTGITEEVKNGECLDKSAHQD